MGGQKEDRDILHVAVPGDWGRLIKAEAESRHLKVSDLFRLMILGWWERDIATHIDFEIKPTQLEGDSMKKMEFLAEQYQLSKHGVNIQNLDGLKPGKSRVMRKTLVGTKKKKP